MRCPGYGIKALFLVQNPIQQLVVDRLSTKDFSGKETYQSHQRKRQQAGQGTCHF